MSTRNVEGRYVITKKDYDKRKRVTNNDVSILRERHR
jgi:hypothetical protein